MLLSRHDRKMIFKLVKYTWNGLIGLIVVCGYTIFFIGLSIYNFIKWIDSFVFYKKHGFTYMELYKKINHMNGRQFEHFMYEIFKANKISCKLTKAVSDGGKDLICKINGQITYIELKRWSGNWNVGRPEVQKLIGSCVGDKVHKAIFITTGQYTKEAIEYASKIPYLELWNMNDTISLCKNVEDKIPYILAKNETITNEDIYHKIRKFNNRMERKNRLLDFQNRYE